MSVATVLVDDEFIRDLTSSALRIAGFATTMASGGLDALAAIERDHPDIVVLDVGLPGGDGFEVCRRLRAAGDQTPVMFLTARDAAEDRVSGFTKGGDDYLAKPFSIEELVARVRAILRRSRAPATSSRLRHADLEIDEGNVVGHQPRAAADRPDGRHGPGHRRRQHRRTDPRGRPASEVGRLGRALNRMLDRIAEALAARTASEQRMRRFVADASHELRTPLTAIRGYAELYRRSADDPVAVATAMDRIEHAATRMGGLVDDLVLLARLDEGRPLDARPSISPGSSQGRSRTRGR